ncbi:MAG TPA: endopeptidase La [Candidatus Polarisedimenticolia bacterium]|nr:endopeptidase La [Candidatus Polarisedimenticolia bacterium]
MDDPNKPPDAPDESDQPPSAAEDPAAGPILAEAPPPPGPTDTTVPPTLPVLALKGTVVFPHIPMPLVIGRAASIRLVDETMVRNRMIALVTQRDPSVEEPHESDLHRIGCAAVIQRLLKFPDGTLRILVSGVQRIRLTRYVRMEPYPVADVEVLDEIIEASVETEALAKNLLNQVRRMLALMPIDSDEISVALLNVNNPGRLADLGAALLVRDTSLKQEFLEILSVPERLRRLTRHISREIEVMELGSKIQEQVQDEMEKGQREFVLRQQLKAIQKELGLDDEGEGEIAALAEAVEKAGMPEQVKQAADRELKRLRTMPPAAAEHAVVRTYLDWLISLPWSKQTPDKIDLKEARGILDEDHFDLDKVKDRILEFLAVRKLRADSKGPILCFVGPPGTGKTSLGKSIARAMGRNFHRLSLGGVRDEAEIRGHRRTYVGALPGRIIEGLRKAGSRNPVFILDEVDKLGMDFRGDPASALLEVLDPEQNRNFQDHYLDVPFDLSAVLFITTANVLDTIPGPLRDRMEVLELPGYTEEDKVQIARRYLIPRQAAENGIKLEDVDISDATVSAVISGYTREAGLRNLERSIGTLCRKVARRRAEGDTTVAVIRPQDLVSYLGQERFTSELAERIAQAGVAVGLAWTPFGGEILFVEATRMPGSKGLIITGQLGDVMRESAVAALSFVRSRAASLGLDPEFYSRADLHLHVPAGAIPKDGPSAGVTMATALASLLTGRPVRGETAMTGEITLRGKVLPVGGIKEKVLAAKRAGIRTILLPEENRKDLSDVPKEALDALTFHFVSTVDDVFANALQPAPIEAPAAEEHAGDGKNRDATEAGHAPEAGPKGRAVAAGKNPRPLSPGKRRLPNRGSDVTP